MTVFFHGAIERQMLCLDVLEVKCPASPAQVYKKVLREPRGDQILLWVGCENLMIPLHSVLLPASTANKRAHWENMIIVKKGRALEHWGRDCPQSSTHAAFRQTVMACLGLSRYFLQIYVSS